jgi:hypothetical protein
MRKIAVMVLIILLALSASAPVYAANKAALDSAVTSTASYILGIVKNPQVDSVGGEWAVIGLARSGHPVPDSYYAGYDKTVEQYVKDRKGVLHDRHAKSMTGYPMESNIPLLRNAFLSNPPKP